MEPSASVLRILDGSSRFLKIVVGEQGGSPMQENQQPSMRKSYSDLVRLHHHALQEAHTCAVSVQDAEQEDEPDLAQFFRRTQQEAARRAQQAQHLLDEHRCATVSGMPAPSTTRHTGHYPGAYPMGMQSTST
jgi:hypothetical protein